MGQALKHEFINTVPVIVPIFDGIKAMSPSVKAWLIENFPGAVDDLENAPSGPGLVDVRVTCGKWWYYCDDTLPTDETAGDSPRATTTRTSLEGAGAPTNFDHDDIARTLSSLNRRVNPGDHSFRLSMSKGHFSANVTAESIIHFNIACIVKRQNHRKHNSHQWFFDGICQGLHNRNSFAFLTDCGTTYSSTCLARLFYELRLKTDLIGVTARQRVETPNLFFHPCEDSPFSFLEGDHKKSGDMRPCWKCYATYYMSPCPLQGFEFEATLIMNSAMFNLVEALPVMPGPCQLLNWQKMKEFRVVEEYFNLLFKGESDKRVPSMPHKFKRMGRSSSGSQLGSGSGSPRAAGSPRSSARSSPRSLTPNSSGANSPMQSSQASMVERESQVPSSTTTSTETPTSQISRTPEVGGITFTEFLRVNMRLAEDRILSFVCVFSTGFGTKWIPGATFFYQPEIRWETLLTQRRRWLNGTFASFLFFFNSKRASDRIKGGMFDSHKAGKNIRLINGLWSLQLVQLVLVLCAPAVFGSASYIGLVEMAKKWPLAFGWAKYHLWGPIRAAEIWIIAYFLVYIVWTFRSFCAPRGRMPEVVCRTIAILGFFIILPVYMSVWWTIATQGLDVINVLVVGSLGLPIVIALAQSVTSAGLYLFYLPWFMFLIVFFLVYIPSYSFARLWDTTWGNRATGNDSAITDRMVDIMKMRNFIFICFLTVANCLCAWAFIGIFQLGYSAVLGFMLIVFFPMIIQLIFSFVFLFVAVPLRYLGLRPDKSKLKIDHGKQSNAGLGEGGHTGNPIVHHEYEGSSGRLVDVETGQPARGALGNLRIDTRWEREQDSPGPASTATQKVSFQRGL